MKIKQKRHEAAQRYDNEASKAMTKNEFYNPTTSNMQRAEKKGRKNWKWVYVYVINDGLYVAVGVEIMLFSNMEVEILYSFSNLNNFNLPAFVSKAVSSR